MTKPTTLTKLCVLLAALALPAAGACRQAHLGADHGGSYRAAFAAQRSSEAPAVGPMDSADAHRVLGVHHGGKKTSRGNKKSTSSSGAAASSGAALSGGELWKGSEGGIKLDAK